MDQVSRWTGVFLDLPPRCRPRVSLVEPGCYPCPDRRYAQAREGSIAHIVLVGREDIADL